jgi:hypothetical protein
LVGSLPLPSGIQKSDGKITMLFSWVKQLEIDWAMASIANRNKLPEGILMFDDFMVIYVYLT